MSPVIVDATCVTLHVLKNASIEQVKRLGVTFKPVNKLKLRLVSVTLVAFSNSKFAVFPAGTLGIVNENVEDVISVHEVGRHGGSLIPKLTSAGLADATPARSTIAAATIQKREILISVTLLARFGQTSSMALLCKQIAKERGD